MDWDAIGAVGELIGATAVVVSVGYLAVQVRKQTDEARMSATRDLAAQFHDTLGSITEDERFVASYLKGIQNYSGLPDVERLRVSLFLIRTFRLWEQQYLHTTGRSVHSTYFESMDTAFKEMLTFPGVREWWGLSGDAFPDGFRNYVERALAEPTAQGYRGSFQQAAKGTATEP